MGYFYEACTVCECRHANIMEEHLRTAGLRGDVMALQVAVIMSNPDQSKHLETARMIVAGLELDLVNLRSEKYADQTSRIPTMEFGTPEEDALR